MPYAFAAGAYTIDIKASSWSFKSDHIDAMPYDMATQASSDNFRAYPLDVKTYASTCNPCAVEAVQCAFTFKGYDMNAIRYAMGFLWYGISIMGYHLPFMRYAAGSMWYYIAFM